MKTAIFTFNQQNYGALLQAFALQRTVEKITGDTVEQVEFSTGRRSVNSLIFYRAAQSGVVQLAFYGLQLLFYPVLRRKWRRIAKFRAEFLKLTRHHYSSLRDLEENAPVADLYLTGSDQVFSLRSNRRDIFYLNFNPQFPVRRAAYAPSFGQASFTPQEEEYLASVLHRFDFLSGREASGAAILAKITGKPVPVVLDPVYLMTSEEWTKVAIPPGRKPGSYIFVYDLNGGKPLIEMARQLGAGMNLPVVCQTDKIQKFYPVKRVYDCGPRELIGYIANAAYVVTDSFHGTAFSVLFGRPFLSYIATAHSSERITGILEKFGLSDHLSWDGKIPAGWEKLTDLSDGRLQELRRESMNFLTVILK